MTPQTSSTVFAAEESGKTSIARLLAGHFIGGGFDPEECEPVSDREFRLLMGIIAISALAFGSIVNGWLI
ncbi:MAG: hypothetical protein NTU47_18125 [Ignavibacteriales bacterium]|nr:hypothetical protein [Ignavibacteriales bacterium]